LTNHFGGCNPEGVEAFGLLGPPPKRLGFDYLVLLLEKFGVFHFLGSDYRFFSIELS